MKRVIVLTIASTALVCPARIESSVAEAQARERFVLHMNVNPLVSAFQDLGFRIVAKEIWQHQTQEMGDKAPPSSTWELFTQLELRLDKRGSVLSVRTISGTHVQGLANGLVGIEIHQANGVDKIFGRFWLLRQSASASVSRGSPVLRIIRARFGLRPSFGRPDQLQIDTAEYF